MRFSLYYIEEKKMQKVVDTIAVLMLYYVCRKGKAKHRKK